MYQFNNQLEVGQLAMIINTRKPENRHLIGTVVTVEAFWHEGQDITEFYPGSAKAGWKIVATGGTDSLVVVSGCGYTGKTRDGQFSMEPGWTNLRSKYLMPLPPLEEKEVKREMELTQ